MNFFKCSICTEALLDEYFAPQCGHVFHFICLTRWLNSAPQPSCPNCRKPIKRLNKQRHQRFDDARWEGTRLYFEILERDDVVLDEEVANMDTIPENIQDIILKAKEDIRTLQTRIVNSDREIDGKKLEIETLTKEIELIKSTHLEQDRIRAAREHELNDEMTVLRERLAESRFMEQKLEDARTKTDKANSEVTKLKKQIEQIHFFGELKQMATDLRYFQKKDIKDETMSRFEEALQNNSKLTLKFFAHLRKQYLSTAERNNCLKTENDTLNAEVTSLRAELRDLVGQVSELTSERDKLRRNLRIRPMSALHAKPGADCQSVETQKRTSETGPDVGATMPFAPSSWYPIVSQQSPRHLPGRGRGRVTTQLQGHKQMGAPNIRTQRSYTPIRSKPRLSNLSLNISSERSAVMSDANFVEMDVQPNPDEVDRPDDTCPLPDLPEESEMSSGSCLSSLSRDDDDEPSENVLRQEQRKIIKQDEFMQVLTDSKPKDGSTGNKRTMNRKANPPPKKRKKSAAFG